MGSDLYCFFLFFFKSTAPAPDRIILSAILFELLPCECACTIFFAIWQPLYTCLKHFFIFFSFSDCLPLNFYEESFAVKKKVLSIPTKTLNINLTSFFQFFGLFKYFFYPLFQFKYYFFATIT